MTLFDKKHLFFFLFTLILTSLFYHFIDKSIALYFHQLHANENTIYDIFTIITAFGNSALYLIPSILLYVYFKKINLKPKAASMALYIFVTNAVAGVLVWLLKVPFGRARPIEFLQEKIYGFHWFEIKPDYVSFPSGHTITIISTVVAFSLLFPKWKYLFLPLGGVVAFSRVVLTEHYMSDIIFASFLGAMVAILLHKYYFNFQES